MDRSYEDERKNLVEQIKSLLVAKIDSIHKTVQGVDLTKELTQVRAWKVAESSYDTNHSHSRSHIQVQSRNNFGGSSVQAVNFWGLGTGSNLQFNLGTLGA